MRVIDTGSASAAIAMLALAVQRRLERGTTDEEWTSFVARFKRESGLVFTLDTLEYLARGGRIGRAAGWAGQLLHIKPILTIEDGEVLPLKRVRGNRKAVQEFANAFRPEPGRAWAPRWNRARRGAGADGGVEEPRPDVRPQAEIEIVTTLGPSSAPTPGLEPLGSSGYTTSSFDRAASSTSRSVTASAACVHQRSVTLFQ